MNNLSSPAEVKAVELLQTACNNLVGNLDPNTISTIYENALRLLPNIINNLKRQNPNGLSVQILNESIYQLIRNIQSSFQQQPNFQQPNFQQPNFQQPNFQPNFQNFQPQQQNFQNFQPNFQNFQPQQQNFQSQNPANMIKEDNSMSKAKTKQFTKIINSMKEVSLSSQFKDLESGGIKTKKAEVYKNSGKLVILGDVVINRPYLNTKRFLLDLESDNLFIGKADDCIILKANCEKYRKYPGASRKAFGILSKLALAAENLDNSKALGKSINEFVDNNHDIVKSCELILIEKINELLKRYIRTNKNIKLEYKISEISDLIDLIALPNKTTNPIVTHKYYLPTINNIIKKVFIETVTDLILPKVETIPHFVEAKIKFEKLNIFDYAETTDLVNILNDGILTKSKEINLLSNKLSGKFNSKDMIEPQNMFESLIVETMKSDNGINIVRSIIKNENNYEILELGRTLEGNVFILQD